MWLIEAVYDDADGVQRVFMDEDKKDDAIARYRERWAGERWCLITDFRIVKVNGASYERRSK